MSHDKMSSADMANALEKFKKGCSEDLLVAVAKRLRRNADLIERLKTSVSELSAERKLEDDVYRDAGKWRELQQMLAD